MSDASETAPSEAPPPAESAPGGERLGCESAEASEPVVSDRAPGTERLTGEPSTPDAKRFEVYEDFAANQQWGGNEQPEGTHDTFSAEKARIKVAHDLGVRCGEECAEKDGLTATDPETGKAWVNPDQFIADYGKGIDAIRFDGSDPVIVEYKGVGVADPSERPTGDQILAQKDQDPAQLTDKWVENKIGEMRAYNDPMADRLQQAYDSGSLTCRMYVTTVDSNGEECQTYQAEFKRKDIIPAKKGWRA